MGRAAPGAEKFAFKRNCSGHSSGVSDFYILMMLLIVLNCIEMEGCLKVLH